MTAPARSDVSFDVTLDGEEKSLGFRIDFNTIVDIEEALKAPFPQVAVRIASGAASFTDLRIIALHALTAWKKKHTNKSKKVMLTDAGDIVQALGIARFADLLNEAVEAGFPDLVESEDTDEEKA